MIDVASITPSTRDFLQAIASNRKRLVLVPLIDRVEDAVALAAAGVTAFAVAAPGSILRAVSASTGSAPILCLGLVTSRDDALVARASGADAVVIDAASDGSRWSSLAREASSARMASLALVVDDATSAVAASVAARGVYLKAHAAVDLSAMTARLGSARIVAHLPSADERLLRALRGRVDAAIVESDLYLSTSFDTLREELDP